MLEVYLISFVAYSICYCLFHVILTFSRRECGAAI